MRSHPYFNISEPVASTARRLIESADGYHKAHAARLTRTGELLYQHAAHATKILELGTSGFIPMLCRETMPHIAVEATHFDRSIKSRTDVEFALGPHTITTPCYSLDLEYGNLPVLDETYDIVLCCEVLEHMEVDPMHMLAEVNRVLKTGGLMLLTTPNITSTRALHKMLVDGLEPHFYMQYHRDKSYNRHNYEYSAPTLVNVLKAAGFSGQVWSEDLFDDPLGDVVERLRSVGYGLPNVGDNLIAFATKVSGIVDRYPRGLYI